MVPRSLETMIDDAARELAANDKERHAELVALRTTLMLVISDARRLDREASQTIAALLTTVAASRRGKADQAPREPIAIAMERLADDLVRRLPTLPPPNGG